MSTFVIIDISDSSSSASDYEEESVNCNLSDDEATSLHVADYVPSKNNNWALKLDSNNFKEPEHQIVVEIFKNHPFRRIFCDQPYQRFWNMIIQHLMLEDQSIARRSGEPTAPLYYMESLLASTSLDSFTNPKVLSKALRSYVGYGEILLKYCASKNLEAPVDPSSQEAQSEKGRECQNVNESLGRRSDDEHIDESGSPLVQETHAVGMPSTFVTEAEFQSLSDFCKNEFEKIHSKLRELTAVNKKLDEKVDHIEKCVEMVHEKVEEVNQKILNHQKTLSQSFESLSTNLFKLPSSTQESLQEK